MQFLAESRLSLSSEGRWESFWRMGLRFPWTSTLYNAMAKHAEAGISPGHCSEHRSMAMLILTAVGLVSEARRAGLAPASH